MKGAAAARFTESGNERDRILTVFRMFPVTTLVISPYLILILAQALMNSNPDTNFILGTMALATGGSFLMEVLLSIGHRTQAHNGPADADRDQGHRQLFFLAKLALTVAAVAALVGVFSGSRTIFSQVSGSGNSSGGSLSSIFDHWQYAGIGLMIASYLKSQCPRGSLIRWTIFTVFVSGVAAAVTAIMEPLISLVIFVVIVFIYFEIIRLRHALGIGLILLLVWPAAYSWRNDIRADGGIMVSQSVDANDRLRFDTQITRAAGFTVPNYLGQPGPTDILRYGVLPRVLDPDRPEISTGKIINVFLGGSARSSYTFLPVATLYFLEGPFIVCLVYAGWAVAMHLLMRSRVDVGPIRIMVFCLLVSGPLHWFATFPDSTIGFVQSLVSILPLALAMGLTSRVRAESNSGK